MSRVQTQAGRFLVAALVQTAKWEQDAAENAVGDIEVEAALDEERLAQALTGLETSGIWSGNTTDWAEVAAAIVDAYADSR